jgi:uncharacterized protein YndB with AHSA1/START domain
MAPIEVSVDIARPHDEVFASVTDPSRFAEWQAGAVGGHMEDGDRPSVGSHQRSYVRAHVARLPSWHTSPTPASCSA